MNKNKIFAFDVDGVLLDFMASFDYASRVFLGKEVLINKNEIEQDHYHLGKRINKDIKTVEKILEFMFESGIYENFDPLPGAKEALEKIKKLNYKMVIVTAIPENTGAMRLKNLKDKLEFIPDESYFVGMGSSKAKALSCISPDIFIDDRLEYLSSAPKSTHHLVWCDRNETQEEIDFLVHARVNSLKEWVDNYLKKVDKDIENYKIKGIPIQSEFRLEGYQRKKLNK